MTTRFTQRNHHFFRICTFLLFWLASTASFSQAPTPFDCASGLGYILTNASSPGGNVTSVHSFNLSDGADVVIKDGVLPAPNRFYNAFGYNTVDNFLYGFRYGTSQIARVGANGEAEILSVTGLNSTGQYATGDVSPNGVLYLYGSLSGAGNVVAIDLNPASANYLVAQSPAPSGINLLAGLNDWSFSPIDGKIYGMTTSASLVRYDTGTNTITTVGAVAGLSGETGAYGTAFMDNQGNMYVGNNASGNMYKIPTPHAPSLPIEAEFFSSSLAGKSPGDGARCPSQAIPPSANSDQACVAAPDNAPIVINVTENDGVGSFPIDLSSLRLIDPVSGLPVTSVTIAGQGTFSVLSILGIVTFTPVTGFSGSSVQYSIKDEEGNESGQATILVEQCPLPVTLISFTAKSTEQTIGLEWKTTMETNFDRFSVERSLDPRRGFEWLSSIPSKESGSGSSYFYQDQTLQPNTIYYYRLKMIDLDGSYAYSKMVSARWEQKGTLTIAPNPAQSSLKFTCAEPIESYQLANSSGRPIITQSGLNSKQIEVSLSRLAKGMYVLRVTTKAGRIERQKFVIE